MPTALFGDSRLPQRFWDKVIVNASGCWLWTGAANSRDFGGYGIFRVGRKLRYAHRHAYQKLVGRIPKGKECDHLCRNTLCCNPAHIEPVTHLENIARSQLPALYAKKRAQTHCKRGHELSGDNLRIDNDGGRTCRECAHLRYLGYRHGVPLCP